MDDLIQKAYGGGLSASDRREMMEQYKVGQMKQESFKAPKGKVLTKDDPLNMPRHQVHGKCASFHECPLCFKCRNFNSSHSSCRSCVLFEEGKICNTEKHNEKVLNFMIRRPRVDLDGTAFRLFYVECEHGIGHLRKVILPGGEVVMNEGNEKGNSVLESLKPYIGQELEYFINNKSCGKFKLDDVTEDEYVLRQKP